MLPTNGIYQIMIGTWGTASLFQIIFNLIAFISGTLLCVIHYRLETEHRRNDQFLLGLKVFGLMALMLISNLICQVFDGFSGCYHSFSSPDGLHTIVVGEEQIIHHVTITVYERLNPLIICSRDSDVTDSTNKPIEDENSFPGTYTVPDGWIQWEEVSQDGVYAYIEKGHEEDLFPDNIAIRTGENPYSLEDHVSFREAILQQLAMQLNGEDVEVTGSGSNTAQGYILYTFTIEDPDGMITRQYYILQDYSFCLVQVTSFTGSENESIFEAAQSIVDSFVWNEDNKQEE